jgi:Spy/CpxP family protein refolding chaperone
MCGMMWARGLMLVFGLVILAKFARRAYCGGRFGHYRGGFGRGYCGAGGHDRYHVHAGECGGRGPGDGPWNPWMHGGPQDWHGYDAHGQGAGPYRSNQGYANAFDGGGQHFGGELGRLLQRLDLSTDQWLAVRKAMREVKLPLEPQVGELVSAQREVASAFRGESFDENALGSAMSRVEGAIDVARKGFIAAFASVHLTLDPRQRALVADFLDERAERSGRRFASRWF